MIKRAIVNFIRSIRGEVSTEKLIKDGLIVGRGFNRQGGCIIDPPHCWLIKIGDNVTLAKRVYILAHDASTKLHLGYTRIGKVNIGNNVFIGASTIILPNVNIGNDVIIGAGSVVTKSIPSNSVAVGNPAKVVSKLDEYLVKNKIMLKNNPVFDETYTKRKNVSKIKKEEMMEKIDSKIGFIV